ncbi:hypothetical protein E4U61_004944 [Claviceps capensis]|nr:hypothetical protein E4U61_004944 [Claviceps capensis]
MKRAGEGKAVGADLDVVIRLFQDKYPLTFLPEELPEERDKPTNPKLRQGDSDVLEAYYIFSMPKDYALSIPVPLPEARIIARK